MKKNKWYGYLFFLITFAVLCVLLFYKLGNGPAWQTDEATHGVNAYEMLKNHSFLVNTYKYADDYYNTKPPFSLWCMMLSYKLLGPTAAAMRMPAAIAAIITFFLVSFYLYKERDIFSAVLFGMSYTTGFSLFYYHGYRSGDMDSLYMMFFAIAMLALMKLKEHKWYLYIYGAAVALAFLTKGTHAVFILFIGVIALPFILKIVSWKDMFISAAICLVMIMGWMIPRYLYDGFDFIKEGFIGEVANKVNPLGQDKFYALRYLLHQKTWDLLVIMVFLALVVGIWSKDLLSKERIFEIIKTRHVVILWTAALPILYWILGTVNEWYMYPAYVGASVSNAYLARYVFDTLRKKIEKTSLQRAAIAVVTAGFIFVWGYASFQIYRLVRAVDEGGNNIVNYAVDVKNCVEEFPEVIGKNAYIINGKSIYKHEDEWENDFVFYAETLADWKCIDGGADAFLEDPDAIIVVDKRLWDKYFAQIAGHVILTDNNFLIFSAECY